MKTSLALLSAALFAAALPAGAVHAQQIGGGKPMRMMVGFAPGGANDMLARLIGQRMSESLGQSIVVENRTGAAGIIASEFVVRSAPDGATLLLGSIGAQCFVPLLRSDMPYDTAKDLLPVTHVGMAGTVLTVNPSIPAKSVRDLVALAKAHPGKLTFASGGNGNSLHIAGELFKSVSGVNMLHVPFKGNAPALTAVLSGEVDLIFSAVAPVLPLAKAGKLRLLGVSTQKRLTGLEEIPTIAESGVPQYEMSSWYGVFATGKTPPDIATRISGEVNKALQVAQVRNQMLGQGIEPTGGSPVDFQKFIASELSKWGKVIKAANIQVN
ncbi:MAG: tripartite tricarboxylate transporter substrate binding protein [Burkholderiales bacterium]|nr:tripartite tricarboxylate transporter substrate binding protein [Burkholderiales bacterium]MCW5603004.1 tripartite tricarboxylate transporter substrate binding protein [Burkholderiales bacterium]